MEKKIISFQVLIFCKKNNAKKTMEKMESKRTYLSQAILLPPQTKLRLCISFQSVINFYLQSNVGMGKNSHR